MNLPNPTSSAPLPAAPAVLIIGGGLAGLAAASALAPRGLDVTLVEARPRLGGRAGSFLDPVTGEWLDNCQHVTMGCCTNLADFCGRVGIAHLLRSEPTLYFQDERGGISRMRAGRLPAPFHLAASILSASFLSLGDKLRIVRGIWSLMRTPTSPTPVSFLDWLLAHGQTIRTCQRFWGVVLTSALNESLDRIDFRYARQVFVEGFLAHREAAVVCVPNVPLSELYGDELIDWLARHRVNIRCNVAAAALECDSNRVVACETRSGERLSADHYLLATPVHRVTGLLPTNVIAQHPSLQQLDAFQSSPITSVHLWFDRQVMETPHLVCVGRTVQWLFRRNAAAPDIAVSSDVSGSCTRQGHYVQAVISASRELAALGNDGVRDRVIAELAQIVPLSRSARLVHHRVVTERAATYSILPGIDRIRPDQRSPISNLWLAGDYTQTNWPATMEGAVRSGYLAAAHILATSGRGAFSLTPPLPRSRLVRWFCKS